MSKTPVQTVRADFPHTAYQVDVQVAALRGPRILNAGRAAVWRRPSLAVGYERGPADYEAAGTCYSKEPFLTTLRGLASYVVPKIDVRLSGTFRSQPGDLRTATWVLPNR